MATQTRLADQLDRLQAAGMHWAVVAREGGEELLMAGFYIHCAAEIFVKAAGLEKDARVIGL